MPYLSKLLGGLASSNLLSHKGQMNASDQINHRMNQSAREWGFGLEWILSRHLVSPVAIELPIAVRFQAEAFARGLFRLRQDEIYQRKAQESFCKPWPKNFSVLMGYDFHLDNQGQLRLIEVNTNASFYGLGSLLYSAWGVECPFDPDPLEQLRQDFLFEYDCVRPGQSFGSLLIMDENPSQQRLSMEFEFFAAVFRSWGWKSEIIEPQQLTVSDLTNEGMVSYQGQLVEMIYNRWCDFFLEGAQQIRKAFRFGKLVLSPQPVDYALLADKKNLVLWSQSPQLGEKFPEIQKCLLATENLSALNAERLWHQRGHLVFKPAHSFGSKGVYRGKSITKRVFSEILKSDYVAQEICPPNELITPEGSFKMDLRFYGYRDRLELALARLYRGQVTGFREIGGGFAPVIFSEIDEPRVIDFNYS